MTDAATGSGSSCAMAVAAGPATPISYRPSLMKAAAP